MTQAEIDAKVKEGVAKALATEKANITQAEVDAKVREGVAKALATEKARQSPATTSLVAPKQSSNIKPNELITLFHSVKRKELAELEQESSTYENRLIEGKERPPSEAQFAEINKWSGVEHRCFSSSNSVFALYLLAREDAGYVAYAKSKRVQAALDNSDFFAVVLNGYKKYPGLQDRTDLFRGAEAFGKGFPLVKQRHVIFTIKDDILYCDEDKDNTIRIVVSNIYRKQMMTEAYRNARDK